MAAAEPRRLILQIVGVAGAAIFVFFFALTYHTPQWVEDFAANYLEGEVADRVDTSIDALVAPQGDDALSRFAAQLMEQNEARIDELRSSLKREARAQLAACIAELRELSPEQRARLQQWLEEGAVLELGSLQVENSRLTAMIQNGYLRVVSDLKQDVRIFAASNAIAFALLLLVSLLKPEQTRALFVPGVLLAISTLICAWLYLFEQNWLLTLIHGDYLGYAYAAWLGVVYLLLCDVWFNGARITLGILEAIASTMATFISAIFPS